MFSNIKLKMKVAKRIQTYKYKYNYLLSIFVVFVLLLTIKEWTSSTNIEMPIICFLLLTIIYLTIKGIFRKND
jgi:hypothetical protein